MLPSMRRYAVEWYAPDTMIGDGRPLNGVNFVTASGPHAAWDAFEARDDWESTRPGPGRVVVRVGEPDALRELPPLSAIIDREKYR